MKRRRFAYIILTVIFLLVSILVSQPSFAGEKQTTVSEESNAVNKKTSADSQAAEETGNSKETAETALSEVNTLIPVTGIKLDKKQLMLTAGEKAVIKANIRPKDATNKDVKWKSSNKDVATVSTLGEVTARSCGTARITAVTKDGKCKAVCKVRVLFDDLGEESDEFYEPVYWAFDKGILATANTESFYPDAKCTLKEALSLLYNLMDRPAYQNGTSFKNVKKGSDWYDAVSWAQENGLLKNIAKKKRLGINNAIKKEQFVTLLYRLTEEPYVGYDGRFTDVRDNSYYKDAVNWSVENNIADGYRNKDGSSKFLFGTGDKLTREDAVIMIYNYANRTNPAVLPEYFAAYVFPVLRNGDTVSDDLYSKYSNPEYCAEVFAYYALNQGWQYEAVVGALAFMWAEGLSANGTFTYEGCWTVNGPSGAVYDRLLDNNAWLNWVHSTDCRAQMIAHSSYYNDSHYATGLGYCGESNAWNFRNGIWVQTLNRCDSYLAAADMAGVAWQDINFQTHRAMDTILSCPEDPDWRDPSSYTGDAREYCARVFATVGYTAFPVWYDNGQLQAHLNQVEKVRPLVDAVVSHTSMIEEDLLTPQNNGFITDIAPEY